MAKQNFFEANPNTVKTVIIGAIVYFGVLRPILKKLSIIPTPPVIPIKPDNEDPLSPLYWQLFRKKYPNQQVMLLTVASAEAYATRIHKAMADGYTVWVDDEAAIYDVFRNLKNWLQISMVSDAFSKKYKVNLLEYLKQGDNAFSPWAGLNEDELKIVKDIIYSKPKY